jgi:hypothetical protein
MHDLNATQSKHHAAIGGVALNWTHLENYVQSILWRMTGLDPTMGRCITHHMLFRSLCEAIQTIANETPRYQHLSDGFTKLFRECEQLQVKRNETVHALWAIFVKPAGSEQQSVTRLASEVEGMIIRARGSLKIKINKTTASEIDDISEEIIGLSKKLAEFVTRNIPEQN